VPRYLVGAVSTAENGRRKFRVRPGKFSYRTKRVIRVLSFLK